ncbi:MAG: putative transposase [Chloroflexi bacterium]|nr:putative transposase [Chloroflexota bacterium]
MCQTTLQGKDSESEVLFAALELSAKTWKVAMSGRGRTRQITIASGELPALWEAFAKAKERFGLDRDAPVVSCYEAGRDGFWIHRELEQGGVQNVVVDAASIEVDRRKRRAKTDRLDAGRLLAQLQRFHGGERRALRAVAVPSVEQEDARRAHRELGRLRKERTSHSNRMRSLFTLHGYRLVVGVHVCEQVQALGGRLPVHLRAEVLREYERWQLVQKQILELEAQQRHEVAAKEKASEPRIKAIRQLMELRGIGETSARVFVDEFFGWRQFANRRQVAAAAGLTPTPYASGSMEREQGISKAGNKRVRAVLLEIAWGWLRYQPDSPLSRWFVERFTGSGRMRRIGIVALARRLLIDLWRYVRDGVIPAGVKFKTGIVPEGVTVRMTAAAA